MGLIPPQANQSWTVPTPRFCGCAAHQHQRSRVRRGCRIYESTKTSLTPVAAGLARARHHQSSPVLPNPWACIAIGHVEVTIRIEHSGRRGCVFWKTSQLGSRQPASSQAQAATRGGCGGCGCTHCAVLHGGFQQRLVPGGLQRIPVHGCWWIFCFLVSLCPCVQGVACCIGPCVVSSNQTRPRRRRRRARVDRLGKRRGPPVLRASCFVLPSNFQKH